MRRPSSRELVERDGKSEKKKMLLENWLFSDEKRKILIMNDFLL